MTLFGTRLKRLRIAKGWTQRELASRANMSPSLVAQYELYRHEPSLGSLIGLSDAFQISIDKLVGHKVKTDE